MRSRKCARRGGGVANVSSSVAAVAMVGYDVLGLGLGDGDRGRVVSVASSPLSEKGGQRADLRPALQRWK